MRNFPETPAYLGAIALIKELNRHNFQAYLVGGCVRDLLLQRPIQDFDIATSALPEEVETLFPKTIPTGIKFGTITVILEETPYEITTFRGEGTYSDGRRPDSVVFGVSLEEDLTRRDFTINAMAYHPDFGLIDPFQGEIDLQNRQLKAVGVAFQRFSEDYLRILRGLRFSATLGFHIETDTADAMLTLWEGLVSVPRERITNEIKKLVMGKYLENLSDFYTIFEEGIFMGIDCLWEAEEESQLQEKLEEISKAPMLLTLRLALFLSLFVPESGMLRLSKQESQEVDFLCQEPCLAWEEEKHFYQIIAKYGREKTKLLLFYQKCQFPYHRQELKSLENLLGEKHCTSLEELAVNGTDLQERGVSGEMIGKLLKIALNLVLDGTVENEKEALLTLMLGEKRPEENPENQ